MPIIRVVEGDLVQNFKDGKYWGIGHGCNCQRVMGAGIALSIKKEFPKVAEADQTTTFHWRFGSVIPVTLEQGIVFNMYTQRHPGSPREELDDSYLTRLDAIGRAFSDLNEWWKASISFGRHTGEEIFGIPMIGAGLAGGVWEEIQERVDKATPDVKIELVKFKPKEK